MNNVEQFEKVYVIIIMAEKDDVITSQGHDYNRIVVLNRQVASNLDPKD